MAAVAASKLKKPVQPRRIPHYSESVSQVLQLTVYFYPLRSAPVLALPPNLSSPAGRYKEDPL